MSVQRTDVAFVWHMHQPYYRVPGDSAFLLPWVRLHAAKAYNDMARMLERHPDTRATVNFSGVLLQQIEEYTRGGVQDTWIPLSLTPASALQPKERSFIVEHFFSLHWDRLVRPHRRYAQLLELRERVGSDGFDDAALTDLQALFNLGWCGAALRDEHPAVAALARKGSGYATEDVAAVVAAQLDVMEHLFARWRGLAERGQVELITTPHNHPILPLLIDSSDARMGLPQAPLPETFCYPDDADAHVARALVVAERSYEAKVLGMWPAEGSVSERTLTTFERHGVRWVASDEDVLARSLGRAKCSSAELSRVWAWSGAPRTCVVFRDHDLSDRIGFAYARMGAEAAAADLCDAIRARGVASGLTTPLVSLILDGENPWEAYACGGEDFLDALYRRLSGDPALATCRVIDAVEERAADVASLPRLHAGSWIMGNFRIWIGVDAKNRAWDLLRKSRAFVETQKGHVAFDEAMEAIYVAEGSDWFWWYGDDFHSLNDAHFDALFRGACIRAYDVLGAPIPYELRVPLTGGDDRPHLDHRPTTARLRVEVDGRDSHYFEWMGSGALVLRASSGAMSRADGADITVRYGFDPDHLFVRVDGVAPHPSTTVAIAVRWRDGEIQEREVGPRDGGTATDPDAQDVVALPHDVEVVAAWESCAEFAFRMPATMRAEPVSAEIRVIVRDSGVEIASLPRSGFVEISGPSLANDGWFV